MGEELREFLLMLVGLGLGVIGYIVFTTCYCHMTVLFGVSRISYAKSYFLKVGITVIIIYLLVGMSTLINQVLNGSFMPFGWGLGMGLMTFLFRKKPNIFYAYISSIWSMRKFGVSYSQTKNLEKLVQSFNNVRLADLSLFIMWLKETHSMKEREWEKSGQFVVDFQHLLGAIPETDFDASILNRLNAMGFRT